MTASVARGTARRTVRVAVALVVGQAALCAVIGYVTLGAPLVHKSKAARQSDPVAAGPLEVPPALVLPAPTSVAPAPPPASASPRRSPSSSRVNRTSAPAQREHSAAEAPPSLESAPADPSAVAAPPPEPTQAPSPPTGTAFVTPSATPTTVQLKVKVGDPCSPLGADGRTPDGRAVKCLQDVDGALHWVLV